MPTYYTRLDFTTEVRPVFLGNSSTNINMSRLNTDLATDKQRNVYIAQIVLFALSQDRKVLVLSDRVFHTQILHGLVKRGGVSVSKNKKKVMSVMHEWPVIFSTYQLFKEGIDIPSLDTLVFANPITNIEQSVGRIQRQCAHKKFPRIFDVVDVNIDLLMKFYYKRLAFYRKHQIRHKTLPLAMITEL